MDRIPVAIVGATGMVGQRFISLLSDHPWFDVVVLAASARSAGRTYGEVVGERWSQSAGIPARLADLVVLDGVADRTRIASEVDVVFCALSLDKEATRELEEAYARDEVVVVSANSANRWTPDVPVMIPEINPEHMQVIPAQRRRLGTSRGFITAKPNCSIQPYVPALHPLRDMGIRRVAVCTYQAISGAGKTFDTWPEMHDNVIPFIGGEEEKSIREPLKIWGSVDGDRIVEATEPIISAQCIRVPVSDGHMAAVSAAFDREPDLAEVRERWAAFRPLPQERQLPSAPDPFLTYFEEDDRPQTRLDRDAGNGMAITLGRLRPDPLFHFCFIALSHNTVRGAAGGAVLTAELLHSEGYIATS